MANKKFSPKKSRGVNRDAIIEMVKNRRSSIIKHDNRGSNYFSMEDVMDIIQNRSKEGTGTVNNVKVQNKQKIVEKIRKESKNIVVSAAGIADILGFNPSTQKSKPEDKKAKNVPAKLKIHYDNLLILKEIIQHKLNNNEIPSKLLRKNGGFNPEFAFTMLPPGIEALHEIDAALDRIENNAFGICEITGEPISDERLAIFPFTRYSVEGKKEHERQIAVKEKIQYNGAFAEDIDGGFNLYDNETTEE
ncbi:MAG: TraR/DksA family transcriptional regulator [Puniceicoccales bacterium]|jgi:hypothetical protein|nr:TraR/DksA family transcriptional regulator [Puniceicoccales bacterium]